MRCLLREGFDSVLRGKSYANRVPGTLHPHADDWFCFLEEMKTIVFVGAVDPGDNWRLCWSRDVPLCGHPVHGAVGKSAARPQ
jgi:hypothetical protein